MFDLNVAKVTQIWYFDQTT